MKRSFTQTNIGSGQTRYAVKLEGDDCLPGSNEAKFLMWEILRQIVDVPDLARCGMYLPDKLKMYHNGQRWVVEMEATGPTLPNVQ